MVTAVTIFFGLLLVTAGVSLGVLYWRFKHSPAGVWRDRVRDRAAAYRRQLAALGPGHHPPPDIDRLARDLFGQYLRTIPVSTLDAFPGIGPVTVGRLRAEGLRSVADLPGYPFQRLPGIGESKAADLSNAAREVIRAARTRFDAGACPEGEEYRRRVAELSTAAATASAARDREAVAIQAALKRLAPLEELARGVTFSNHLTHRAVPGLTPEVFARPLPEVEPIAAPVEVRPIKLPPPVVVPASPPPAVPVVARAAAPAVARPAPLTAGDLFRAELGFSAESPPATADHPALPKLLAYVRFGLAVARADGRIANAERAALRRFLSDEFGHDPGLARHFDPMLERVEAGPPAEAEAVAGVVACTTPKERGKLFALAERIADSSGDRNQRERDFLSRVRSAFGLDAAPEVAVASPSSVAAEPAADPRAVLGIEPGVPIDVGLIRRRFALLTDKLDPGRAAALGPEFAAMAEAKRVMYRQAAETLLAPFGEPLEPPAAPPPPSDIRHNPDLDDVFGG